MFSSLSLFNLFYMLKKYEIYDISYHFAARRYLENFVLEGKDPLILHNQFIDADNMVTQAISSHATVWVSREYSSFSTCNAIIICFSCVIVIENLYQWKAMYLCF